MSALKTLAFARQPAATRALTHEDIPQVLAIEAASFPVPWSKETFAEEITCPAGLACLRAASGSSGEPLLKVPAAPCAIGSGDACPKSALVLAA